ncbi:MAG: hypothetical protein COX81_01925 [Candidatus Magasanikbacteria bacterium CG_4_10_14_0_2_um_filter_37_12]|uniref:Uncharacterized protein n=1 Tax=Candidatus Magasanikbacteria bacterium CG_4_10_14_0_2_um_filter_37_12 TaxID=1974637 RepID=A0A2M7V8B4_9BACT|nr:MAG: hypothetical protein COX81_01925 [Candidatus Magasanikbacteria bacterium CG_4_10_14_0_2_um_filter_37_12]
MNNWSIMIITKNLYLGFLSVISKYTNHPTYHFDGQAKLALFHAVFDKISIFLGLLFVFFTPTNV